MRVVVDTNLVLISLGRRSSVGWLFKALLSGMYDLLVTTEILAEYEEIISRYNGPSVSHLFRNVIENLENVKSVDIYFNWQLMSADPDDNKFVDCAIAGNADYLVTQDAHFKLLKTIGFPLVRVLDAEEFKQLLFQ
ncbi:MAG: putative toxin-antitoxin system toxin component, PIN family [Ferruginibacter sp.]|nr:putative toxin-antitoxin system toxin component, PIN family [Cytophagales bacterium]